MTRFLFLLLLTGALFPLSAQRVTADGPLAAVVDSLFRRAHREDGMSGALLLARDGEIIYQNALGSADPGSGKALTMDNAFNLASVSKQFTTMCVMILRERGRLAYDDLVRQYLPDFPYDTITVRHLMTHTSGLPEYFDLYERHFPPEKIFTNRDLLDLLAGRRPPLDFRPGDEFRYSNTGYLVLALVVETAAGQDFASFLRENVIRPLGLTHTYPYNLTMPAWPSDRVFGYEMRRDSLALSDLYNIDGVLGDGNVYASVADLHRWSRALYEHRLVSAETMAEAYRPHTLNNGRQSYYGFGWGLRQDSSAVSHSGGWVGFRTYIRRDLKGPYELIVLNNSSGRGMRRLVRGVEGLLTDSTVLIRDVRIADGSGAPLTSGAVRLQGDRILEAGRLTPRPGETVVEGRNRVLAPGFIDTHSHHDRGLFEKRTAPEVVSQGVTTIVIGQDGEAPFPLADFWRRLDSLPAAVNVAAYAGHNTLRERVMPDYRREAAPAEVDSMKALLGRELAAGALGLSTGLEYDPGIYSSREEVLELAEVLAAHQRRYISHLRSEDRRLWEAVDEILAIGRTHRIPVQISHLKIALVSGWGRADSLLAVLEAARAEGVDVTADVYPYEHWQSTMTVLFPERDFRDLAAARYALTELTTPDGMIISAYGPDPSLVGKTLAEIAAARREEPARVYLDLLNTALERNADESIICRSMSAEDVARLATWRWSNLCSDGSLDGRHPRGAGSFPRALRRYVREEKRLPLEEMIRQMTSLAARNVGLRDRGLLRPGYYADLVLLDEQSVTDQATFEQPGALPEGILQVWVNGQEVWRGEPTGRLPGKGLRD